MLQRGNELPGFQQAVVGARIEPGIATLHDLHMELALLQIRLIDTGDFQLATGAGLHRFGNVDHLFVVKVQSGDCIAGFGLRRFFFDADGLSRFIKFDDT